MRVAALTSGADVPSSRFRVRQHIGPLAGFGVHVEESAPAIDKYARVPAWPRRYPQWLAPHFPIWQGVKAAVRLPGVLASRGSDATWLERELLPGMPTLEWALRRPLVFDVDDAIWLTGRFGPRTAASVARRAAAVMAGNAYLAEWFAQYNSAVTVIPTAVDSERFTPRPRSAPDDGFVIGWTGSASGLPYLEGIERPLHRFLQQDRAVRLVVVADKPPRFVEIPPERVEFIPWTPAVEVSSVQRFDVGLMPLPDSPWTRGKCSFKMLQYMACGIPAVVSPVGMNAELLAEGTVGLPAVEDADWYDALSFYRSDPAAARAHGASGRELIERRYSRTVVSGQIARVFLNL